ncbi:sugar phosphotransferase, partial [Streptomyces albogriseolus]
MARASRRIRRLARRGLGVGRKVRDRASAVRLTRQRQGLLGSDAGVRQVSFGGEALWGRVVDGFTAAGAAADNLALVADALERAGISYFVVPGVSRTAWALGVREADREAFLTSMR